MRWTLSYVPDPLSTNLSVCGGWCWMRSKINKCMNTRAKRKWIVMQISGDFNSGVEDDSGESTDTDRELSWHPTQKYVWMVMRCPLSFLLDEWSTKSGIKRRFNCPQLMVNSLLNIYITTIVCHVTGSILIRKSLLKAVERWVCTRCFIVWVEDEWKHFIIVVLSHCSHCLALLTFHFGIF